MDRYDTLFSLSLSSFLNKQNIIALLGLAFTIFILLLCFTEQTPFSKKSMCRCFVFALLLCLVIHNPKERFFFLSSSHDGCRGNMCCDASKYELKWNGKIGFVTVAKPVVWCVGTFCWICWLHAFSFVVYIRVFTAEVVQCNIYKINW